jgi:hypothetical protein
MSCEIQSYLPTVTRSLSGVLQIAASFRHARHEYGEIRRQYGLLWGANNRREYKAAPEHVSGSKGSGCCDVVVSLRRLTKIGSDKNREVSQLKSLSPSVISEEGESSSSIFKSSLAPSLLERVMGLYFVLARTNAL